MAGPCAVPLRLQIVEAVHQVAIVGNVPREGQWEVKRRLWKISSLASACGRHTPEAAAAEVTHGLGNLLVRVHDERTAPDDRLVERPAAE